MSQTCKTCRHTELAEITRRLTTGESTRAIASAFGLSRPGLQRHVRYCNPVVLERAIERRQERPVLAAHDRLLTLVDEARRLGQLAEESGELSTALGAIREMVRIIELRAKLFGDIDKPAVVNVLVQHPDWLLLQSALLRALEPFPEARAAVLKAIVPAALPETTQVTEGTRDDH
jgi:hypothetical protein